MLSPRRHRLTTSLLLVAYLVANLLSPWFHDHGSASCSHASCSHADCGHADNDSHHADEVACQHEHADSEDQHDDDQHDGGQHNDQAVACHETESSSDDCAICRYVGQRVLPVDSQNAEPLCEVIGELAILPAVEPISIVARTMHSRAPPLLG